MGDEVFPAVTIYRVDRNVRVEEVIDHVRGTIGRDRGLYKNGEPGIQIRMRGTKAEVTISGILLPFNEIRKELCKTPMLIGGEPCPVFVKEPDFGVPRTETGLFAHRQARLHKHKLEASQCKFMNIFASDFCRAVGIEDDFGRTVNFDARKGNIDIQAFKDVGTVVVYSGEMARGTPRGIRAPFSTTSIEYLFRAEALQSIIFLNGDRRVIRRNRDDEGTCQFRIDDAGNFCNTDGTFGLGRNGTFLDIAYFESEYGYIPLQEMYQDLICPDKLQRLEYECFKCSQTVTIRGISADLDWLAVGCGCLNNNTPFKREGENFLRKIVSDNKRGILRRPLQMETDEDAMINQLPAIPTLHKDVKHFNKTTGVAYKSERGEAKRIVHGMQTNSEAIYVEPAGLVLRKNKEFKKLLLELVVPTTKFWNEDVVSKAKKAVLVPLEETVNKKGTKVSYAASKKNNQWFHAIVKAARIDTDDPGKCVVTVHAFVSKGHVKGINEGNHLRIIPRPPTNEQESVKRALTKIALHQANKANPLSNHFGSIDDAYLVKSITWTRGPVDSNMWSLAMQTANTEPFHRLEDSLKTEYVGAEITFKAKFNGKEVEVKDTARVTYAEVSPKNPNLINLDLVTILSPKLEISSGGTICAQFWKIVKKASPIGKNRGNIFPAGYVEDEMETNQENDEVADDSDDDDMQGLEENFHDGTKYMQPKKKVQKDEPPPTFLPFEIFFDPNLSEDLLGMNNAEDIAAYWRIKPAIDPEIADFLFAPSETISHKVEHRDFIEDDDIFACMNQTQHKLFAAMNEHQQQAVLKMIRSLLTSTQGPPGTGKSQTGALGMSYLTTMETGLILATAPSNYACKVLYEKLKAIRVEHKMNFKITWMLSKHRETLNKKGQFLEKEDPDLLHNKFKRHDSWGTRDDLNNIIQKAEENGGARMSSSEEQWLQKYRQYLTNEILHKETDILICTTGTACDATLECAILYGRSKNRELATVVIDEGSLVTTPMVIPIVRLNPTRIWILGDVAQLPPCVQNEDAKHAGLDISWMESLSLTPYMKNNDVFTLLTIQYRMADSINYIVSNLMYDGAVISSDEVMSREEYYRTNFPKNFPQFQKANMMISTYDQKVETREAKSYYNQHETDITKKHLIDFVEGGTDPKKICVVSMYEAQLTKNREMLDSLGPRYRGIELATVDSFQGKEMSIVIINTCRSNKDAKNRFNIGFLRDTRRLNVAISRAKDYLVMVTDIETMVGSTIPEVRTLFTLAADKDVQVTKYNVVGNGETVDLRGYLRVGNVHD